MNIIVPAFLEWKNLLRSFSINILDYPAEEFHETLADFFSKRVFQEFDDENLLLYFVEKFDEFKRVFQHYPSTIDGLVEAVKFFRRYPNDVVFDEKTIDKLKNFLTVWNNAENYGNTETDI